MRKRPPTRTIELPCPHCGQAYTVVNGLYLRARRLAAGLSQRALGRRIHASGPHISDWECNRRAVPASIEAAYLKLPRKS